MSTSSFPAAALSPDGSRWIACKPGFFLPVRVLSRRFRRLFLEGLAALHKANRLVFFGDLAPRADKRAFDAALAPLRRSEWVVYAKRPFAGPQAVLAYLSRYTPSRGDLELQAHRARQGGRHLQMEGLPDQRPRPAQDHDPRRRRVHPPLPPARAAQRLPPPRHYGLFAGTVRARNIERVRQLLAAPKASPERSRADRDETSSPSRPCACCGGRMIIVETFEGTRPERSPSLTRIRIDTS